MRHWSGRGQAEPFAALAAILAVSAGMVVYAGVLDEAVPGHPDDETPDEILDGVHDTLRETGVVDPGHLDAAVATVPDGWEANVTLTTERTRWQRGPTPPASPERATRRVSVQLSSQRIRPGQLRVVVWR